MVGVALFGHEDYIHAHVKISKDGVTKIVDAVGVSGIVGIGVGQDRFQSLIPSSRIGQTRPGRKTWWVACLSGQVAMLHEASYR